MPRLVSARHVPLFERFLEELDDRRIVEPYRVQELSLLIESIQTEIGNLLNTRLSPRPSSMGPWEPASKPETVLDYGLPAFSHLNAGSYSDLRLLNETILAKIVSFEPRMENPRLDLRRDPDDPAALLGELSGQVTLYQISQPVCFPISLRGEKATVLRTQS